MKLLISALTVLLLTTSARAAEPWETVPPTPKIDAPLSRITTKDGATIAFRTAGQGDAVVLLHGGPANSNYLAGQFNALARTHRVVAIDTRGHGNSTFGTAALSYDQMADDVIAVMDDIAIDKAAVVGWSDGGITGLDLAMRYRDRIAGVFAYGANASPDGVEAHPEEKPAFAEFLSRAEAEYGDSFEVGEKTFSKLNGELSSMYAKQPNWSAKDLAGINVPVVISDGDHDEVIKREHTTELAADIPGAGLLIIPHASHFGFLQQPDIFNAAVDAFLARR